MPREADPQLENRILDAAGKLWNSGGVKNLTMRAVAKAAGTTTPTVYERFRDKQDILRALRSRTQQSLFAALQPSRSPAEACQRYIEFALERPSEYELLFTGLGTGAWRNEPRPSFEMMKRALAMRWGGSPRKYTQPALALWSLLHGTATILLASKEDPHLCKQLRSACLAAFERLVNKAKPQGNSHR